MHWNFDMYTRNRVDTSPSPVDWGTMVKHLGGFIGFMLLMFYLGETFPSYQPVVRIQMAASLSFLSTEHIKQFLWIYFNIFLDHNL